MHLLLGTHVIGLPQILGADDAAIGNGRIQWFRHVGYFSRHSLLLWQWVVRIPHIRARFSLFAVRLSPETLGLCSSEKRRAKSEKRRLRFISFRLNGIIHLYAGAVS